MPGHLPALRQDFLRRTPAGRVWGGIAVRASRPLLALALCLAPSAILLAAILLGPDELGKAATSSQNVHETFARFVSAIATASAIAVSVATMTMGRELKGVQTHQRRSRTNDEFRERVRASTGRESMPTSLGAFAAATLEGLEADARRALRDARDAGLDPRLDDVTLQEYLETLADRSALVARRVALSRGHPNRLMVASHDFEEEIAAHYARRFARLEELPESLRAQLDDVVARILDVSTISKYAKTMNLQWGLSRMAMAITLAALPSLVTAAAMTLLYGQGAVDALGLAGAGALVAGAFAVTLLPVALFVSYVIRFVFLNQRTLPTEGFVLGPEEPEALDSPPRPRRAERSRAPLS